MKTKKKVHDTVPALLFVAFLGAIVMALVITSI